MRASQTAKWTTSGGRLWLTSAALEPCRAAAAVAKALCRLHCTAMHRVWPPTIHSCVRSPTNMPHLPLPPRLANPWPELAAYVNSLDLGTAEDHVHSHIPYGVCQVCCGSHCGSLGLWRFAQQHGTMARHGTAWHGMAWHGRARRGTARDGTAWQPCGRPLTLAPTPPLLVVSPAVLLAKAAKQWQQEHGGALPSSTAERSAFKELLKGWQRDINGIPLEAGFGGRVGLVVRRCAGVTCGHAAVRRLLPSLAWMKRPPFLQGPTI